MVVEERSGCLSGLLRRCYQKKLKLWGGSLGCLPFLSQLFGKFLLSLSDFLRLWEVLSLLFELIFLTYLQSGEQVVD